MPPHHPFGLFHIAWLAGIAGMSILLSFVCRRKLIPDLYIRIVLGCLLAGGELLRFFTDQIRFPDLIPLNLCNITAWVGVVACLTLWPMAVAFTYFAGFCGAGMALLTPDLGSHWPSRFFVAHGAIILTASALVFGRIAPLRRGAVWRAYGWFALYIGLAGIFDWKFGVNFGYLCQKPGTGTVLSWLGPWPYYLIGAGLVGLGLFWLLWLPVRPRGADGVVQESLLPETGSRVPGCNL